MASKSPRTESAPLRAMRGPLTGFLIGLLLATATLVGLATNTTHRAIAGGAMVLSAVALVAALQRDERSTRLRRERQLNDILLSPSLAGRDLKGGDLEGAVLRSRTFDGSSLRNANLQNADLTDASMDNTDLRDTSASGVSLVRVSLKLADLSGADLSHADLTHADLSNANLQDANLVGADLRDTNLEGANLCGADLSEALVMRTLLQHASYDATTRLPYSLTSERRRAEGLRASADTTIRPRIRRTRRLSLAPGFAVAVFAGLVLTAGAAVFTSQSGLGSPTSNNTQVLGAVEERPVGDGRTLFIESNHPVLARFHLVSGNVVEVTISGNQTIENPTVQLLTKLTVKRLDDQPAEGNITCTLLRDAKPTGVAVSAETVSCPLS